MITLEALCARPPSNAGFSFGSLPRASLPSCSIPALPDRTRGKTHRDIPKNPQNAPIRHLPAPTSTPWVSTPNFRGHDSAPDTPRPPPTNGNPNPGPWAGTTPFLPPHKGGIDPQSTVPAGTRGKSVNFRGRDFGKPSPRPIQARNSEKNHQIRGR